MPIVMTIRQDDTPELIPLLAELPDKIVDIGCRSYFPVMMKCLEEIMGERISGIGGTKSRQYNEVYDPILGQRLRVGSSPLIRSGELLDSLTNSNSEYAIRTYNEMSAYYGTKRLPANILRAISSGHTFGVRVRGSARRKGLRWQNPEGVWNKATMTMDSGANIPQRKFLFTDKPMTSEENRRMKEVSIEYWANFFAASARP
jgi:hypothetical protein